MEDEHSTRTRSFVVVYIVHVYIMSFISFTFEVYQNKTNMTWSSFHQPSNDSSSSLQDIL
jgi:cytochrome b subunit of formate dehydrogenase